MYFTLTISMYQDTKMALKNVLFLVFFFFFSKCKKTSNLWALLTRSENLLLGNIFTYLCCNCDTKHTCKRSFQLTKPNFSESDVNMLEFSAEFLRPQRESRNSAFCWISQNKILSDNKINK